MSSQVRKTYWRSRLQDKLWMLKPVWCEVCPFRIACRWRETQPGCLRASNTICGMQGWPWLTIYCFVINLCRVSFLFVWEPVISNMVVPYRYSDRFVTVSEMNWTNLQDTPCCLISRTQPCRVLPSSNNEEYCLRRCDAVQSGYKFADVSEKQPVLPSYVSIIFPETVNPYQTVSSQKTVSFLMTCVRDVLVQNTDCLGLSWRVFGFSQPLRRRSPAQSLEIDCFLIPVISPHATHSYQSTNVIKHAMIHSRPVIFSQLVRLPAPYFCYRWLCFTCAVPTYSPHK
jgi:hypothetical protein